MAEYSKLYKDCEETAFHEEIIETVKAERELAELLKTITGDIKFDLDLVIGKVARAYEMQGFNMALSFIKNRAVV